MGLSKWFTDIFIKKLNSEIGIFATGTSIGFVLKHLSTMGNLTFQTRTLILIQVMFGLTKSTNLIVVLIITGQESFTIWNILLNTLNLFINLLNSFGRKTFYTVDTSDICLQTVINFRAFLTIQRNHISSQTFLTDETLWLTWSTIRYSNLITNSFIIGKRESKFTWFTLDLSSWSSMRSCSEVRSTVTNWVCWSYFNTLVQRSLGDHY